MINLSVDSIAWRSISSTKGSTVCKEAIGECHSIITHSTSAKDGEVTRVEWSNSPSSLIVIINSSELGRTVDSLSTSIDGYLLWCRKG
jgi:hypothetical protein